MGLNYNVNLMLNWTLSFFFINIVLLFVLDYNSLYFKVWNCKKTVFSVTKNSINGIPIVLTPDYKLDKFILFPFSIILKLPTYLHKGGHNIQVQFNSKFRL